MAISRVPGIQRLSLLVHTGCWNAIRSRVFGSAASEASEIPSLNPKYEDTGSDLGSEGLSLAQRRKEYEAKVSVMRKKYMQEMQRKKSQQMRAEHVKRQVILKAKEERLAVKKEKSEARAIEVLKETEILRARYDAQRAFKAAQREKQEKKVLFRKERQTGKIRQESSSWIEKNDLELRILEAMADPIRLTGPLLGALSPVPPDSMAVGGEKKRDADFIQM
ncbi:hypothetical protein O6H91_21G061500 [Diphasiastrum complanatum]|uniref:Uncharacterized protein n=1 Tax=Diphasiastrum complanatum TaxID=34168 RepID=A0ACC2AL08_DIPCM|nr:hypothetical protein O6H91_21G061500 [Diphasiastrum complanatum]